MNGGTGSDEARKVNKPPSNLLKEPNFTGFDTLSKPFFVEYYET